MSPGCGIYLVDLGSDLGLTPAVPRPSPARRGVGLTPALPRRAAVGSRVNDP